MTSTDEHEEELHILVVGFCPQNPVRAKYDPEHSSLLHVYTIAHFLLAFVATEAVVQGNAGLTQATRWCILAFSSLCLKKHL